MAGRQAREWKVASAADRNSPGQSERRSPEQTRRESGMCPSGGSAGLQWAGAVFFTGPSAGASSASRPLHPVARLFTALIQVLAGPADPPPDAAMAGRRWSPRGHASRPASAAIGPMTAVSQEAPVATCSEHSRAGELSPLIRCGCRGLSRRARPCDSSGSRSPLLVWIRRSCRARHLNRSSPPGLSPTSIVRPSLPQRAVSPFLLLTILLTIPVTKHPRQ
jgi:hypothetical protein